MLGRTSQRVAAGLTMLVYLLGLLAMQWHHVEVEHLECVEHGQHHASDVDEPDEAAAGIAALPAVPTHDHHCTIAQFSEPTPPVGVATRPTVDPPQLHGIAVSWSVDNTNHTRADLLRFAPKTSPPGLSARC